MAGKKKLHKELTQEQEHDAEVNHRDAESFESRAIITQVRGEQVDQQQSTDEIAARKNRDAPARAPPLPPDGRATARGG